MTFKLQPNSKLQYILRLQKVVVSKEITMQSQMKNQKKHYPSWQDLNPYILSKIFSFLNLHDQLFGPAFVCHSWLSSTLHTLFQNSSLDLRLIDCLDEENQRLRFTHLLKLAINHYHGWHSIYFPTKHMFGYFATLYIAERTPNISCVVLSSKVNVNVVPIFVSILYWKNLRVFRAQIHKKDLGFLVVSQLADYCKSITELGLRGWTMMEREVTCIVEGFPRLEKLDLEESTLCGNALEILLDGRLKYVKEINILHCKFMGEDGKDIKGDFLKLKAFKNKVLEKACSVRSLKKLRHCLGQSCPHCKDSSLEVR
ncbi:hypothetical protein LOK49_LG07G03104 [Camellia lanceoleosa]|uniref:Uncharacterized protein n=1 Tax=Camellia lanceoleosa TaxID=1840588 RepID=A0ACC0H074_9ERIC|nr:hypothetical protein LOK49_LG07G03104 [Camellia lanceoleosa]